MAAAELLGRHWKTVDETTAAAAPASRIERELSRKRGEILSQLRGVRASRHDIQNASRQIVMCASERFLRGSSSIDYDARGDFRVLEFQGKISETLRAPALRFQRGREGSRSIDRGVVRVSLKKPRYAG